MRLAAYAGASTALAAGVVLYAFNQRTNFYSACVYLAQSNLCLMILTNLILFCVAIFMFGLQRTLYGPLRPIEIEQLYEKAWFAITETCLAMTIFREEVGAWFLVMFVGLLAGKVWGWIGEGRVEVLEQQPPANPRLFHLRLSFSLTLSLLYDIWLLVYTINTVIQQARPNMMVMFLFELAVLTTSSFSTALRYSISLIEARIVKRQTKERLEARRAEIRAERARLLSERAAAVTAEGEAVPESEQEELPSEDDVEEMDIEVQGWEAKGQVILSLELATDFVKLGILTAFFFILLTFYGLPIHIMRDLFLTARSFVKRLTAFVKYRRATRDMNTRYPDATAEEIQREDTCIICREEMRPWEAEIPDVPAGGPPPPAAFASNERQRPKKLPCGHVLHLGCLKSWLERQQVCPTCRRPVVGPSTNAFQPALNAAGQPVVPGQAQQQPGAANAPQAAPRRNPNMRQFGFGPFRVAFGNANLQDMVQGLNNNGQPPIQNGNAGAARMYGLEFGFPRRQAPAPPATTPSVTEDLPVTEQLQNLEQRIMRDIQSLQVNQQELSVINLLQMELARIRSARPQQAGVTSQPQLYPQLQTQRSLPTFAPNAGASSVPTSLNNLPRVQQSPPPVIQRHGINPGSSAIPAGSADLPPGVVLPEGWSLLPLSRLDVPPASGPNVPGPQMQTPASTGPGPFTGSFTPQTTSNPSIPALNSQIHSPAPSRLTSEVLNQEPSILEAQASTITPSLSSAPDSGTVRPLDSDSHEQQPTAAHDTQMPQWHYRSTSTTFSDESHNQPIASQAQSPVTVPGPSTELNANTGSHSVARTDEGSSSHEQDNTQAATVEDAVDEADQ